MIHLQIVGEIQILHQSALVRGRFEGEGGSGAAIDPHKCWTWSVTSKLCALALNLVLAASAEIRSHHVQLRGSGTDKSSFECIQHGDAQDTEFCGDNGTYPIAMVLGCVFFTLPPANSRLLPHPHVLFQKASSTGRNHLPQAIQNLQPLSCRAISIYRIIILIRSCVRNRICAAAVWFPALPAMAAWKSGLKL